MAKVEPVKNPKDVMRWKMYVKDAYTRKHYIALILSLHSVLFPQEVVSLTWDNVESTLANGILELKRRSRTLKIKLSQELIEELKVLRQENLQDIWVFQSETNVNRGGHWNRKYLYTFFKESASEIGIKELIGGDTPRKTFGYHAYLQGVSILQIQRIYNQQSVKKTLNFLCIIEDDDLNKDDYIDIPLQ